MFFFQQETSKSWTALHRFGKALNKWLFMYVVLLYELFLQLLCDSSFSFTNVEFIRIVIPYSGTKIWLQWHSLWVLFVYFNSTSSFESILKWCLKNTDAYSPFQAYHICWSHTLQKTELFSWQGKIFRK